MQKENITKIILEVTNYVLLYKKIPPVGIVFIDGIDINEIICDCYDGKILLTEKQMELFLILKELLSKTEKNIRELELYYEKYRCLPSSRENSRLTKAISDFKYGRRAITKEQQRRLEYIGAFSSITEKMICAIECFYKEYKRFPRIGEVTTYNCDMGKAIVDYRNGRRLLTLNQKVRLEKIGISFNKIHLKQEKTLNYRIKEKKICFRREIEELKQARNCLLETLSEEEQILIKKYSN